MEQTTKNWIAASEKWIEEMELLVECNEMEAAMLLRQIKVNNQRIALLGHQNELHEENMKLIKEKISKVKEEESK